MFTGPESFFRAISIAGIWGDISVSGEAKDTKPYGRRAAEPSSSVTLHRLTRLAGTHIFNSSPSTVSQIWGDLHQSIRAR